MIKYIITYGAYEKVKEVAICDIDLNRLIWCRKWFQWNHINEIISLTKIGAILSWFILILFWKQYIGIPNATILEFYLRLKKIDLPTVIQWVWVFKKGCEIKTKKLINKADSLSGLTKINIWTDLNSS